jgi:hypothetical protein
MGSVASITDAQGGMSGSGGGGGRGAVAGDETAVIALRRILDQEISSRKALEIKVSEAQVPSSKGLKILC